MIQAISFRGDRSPVPPRVKIGFESDNLVESLAFELPELAGDQSAMLMINGNAYANMIDLYRTEDGKWAVDLAAEMVGPAGVYESYVAITCPDGRRWNSGVFDLLTGDLPDVSGAIETLYPTAVEHALQEMAETRQEMAASVTASENAAQRAEDAAQRAEDAANQGGGGSTAPAKDAVLYTAQTLTEEQQAQARENIGAQPTGEYITGETDPTVPDWAKQPEKPTYTAEEVGAASAEAVSKLSEDKADRSEIPEPYVLPVASADTLGGVKINPKDFVMDGDVLSAVGGSNDVYELVEFIYIGPESDKPEGATTVIDDAVGEIVRTDVCYDALRVTMLTTPTGGANRNAFVYAAFSAGDGIAVGSTYIDKDNKYSSRCDVYKNGDIWDGQSSGQVSGWGGGNVLGLNSPSNLVAATKDDYIKSVRLYVNAVDYSIYPVGTIIKIYGVKHNA